jgi:hypothetical protein
MVARLLVLVVCACGGEPRFVAKPLPPLAGADPTSRELSLGRFVLVPGESFIWEVHLRGHTIGRAEMTVEEGLVASRFRTGLLVSAMANVEHDLTTSLDRAAARPLAASERLEYDGKSRQFTTTFAGTKAHSFHSALGVVRAWARPGALPGWLEVVHADRLFRLELERPVVQGATLRVDARVVGNDIDPVLVTIWLDEAGRPARLEIRDGDERVTAELIAG